VIVYNVAGQLANMLTHQMVKQLKVKPFSLPNRVTHMSSDLLTHF